jgi:hypothetical protein
MGTCGCGICTGPSVAVQEMDVREMNLVDFFW